MLNPGVKPRQTIFPCRPQMLMHTPPLTIRKRAKATLRQLRFHPVTDAGPVFLSPRFSRAQRRELMFWISRLPSAFLRRLPPLKLASADQLTVVRSSVFINENPLPQNRSPVEPTHAVSFIPERYIVLDVELFRRRVEAGRILYHELCHFIWPRLGNPRRLIFETLNLHEFRRGVRGELGYSSEWRKLDLLAKSRTPARAHRNAKFFPGISASMRRRWLEYVCESFCDTGAFVLLGSERRRIHSEYTLSLMARKRRTRQWSEIVLGCEAERL